MEADATLASPLREKMTLYSAAMVPKYRFRRMLRILRISRPKQQTQQAFRTVLRQLHSRQHRRQTVDATRATARFRMYVAGFGLIGY